MKNLVFYCLMMLFNTVIRQEKVWLIIFYNLLKIMIKFYFSMDDHLATLFYERVRQGLEVILLINNLVEIFFIL